MRSAAGSTLTLVTLVTLVAAGCSGGDGAAPVDGPAGPAHAPRFVGLWAVEQPTHALYEVTYYRFDAAGALAAVASDPADCSGHLSEHCVTGSVADCVPVAPDERCDGTVTCVFGATWRSLDARTLVIAGACSDAAARDIVLELPADASGDAQWGGAAVTVRTVGGDPAWSHDNWPWAFRKCPAGTGPSDCLPPGP